MSNFILIVLSAAIIYLLLRVRSLENTLQAHVSHTRHTCVTSEDMYAVLLEHENTILKHNNDDDIEDDDDDDDDDNDDSKLDSKLRGRSSAHRLRSMD